MSDPFRGGSFGSVGMGPFRTGGGGDSRYLIANDGDDVALTRKMAAQLAWANGTLTDDAYLGALRAYLGTTDAGSRERLSAQNELDDAVYTIGRNKLVRAVNNASSTLKRVAALRSLISYDRRKLNSMTRDNEQAREMRDRIETSRGQIRDVRYGDLVRRFNADQVGIDAMLRFARNMAAEAQGTPDAVKWQDTVREWTDRADSERLNQLYQDYQQKRIPGSAVVDFLKQRRSRMDPESPDFKETSRQIEDLEKQVREAEFADRDAAMASRVQRGDVPEAEYLKYLASRVKDYEKGTAERRNAEDNLLATRFQFGENEIRRGIEGGTADTQDLVDFYRGYMATMSPTATRFLELQQRVTDLLISGTQNISLTGGQSGGVGIGRWVDLSGAPGGTPVNAKGFASQFDGSPFAGSNCGMASAAMLAWAATDGRIRLSGGDLRRYSGDRDLPGDEAGTTYNDVTIAFQQVGLGLQQHHEMSFDAWKRRLAAGEGSLISGSYSVVPSNLRLSDFQGPHTMYVDRAQKIKGQWYFYVMDPIGRAGYNGRWWPEDAIRAYGWSGVKNAAGGRWYGDVAFASKRGRSSNFVRPDRAAPPFQAFDTDANGASTIGRGGGNSRREAGPRRDWSKGRANEPKPRFTGKRGSWTEAVVTLANPPGKVPADKSWKADDQTIGEFIAAVDSTVGPQLSDPGSWGADRREGVQGTEQDRWERAREILEANGGDARLAAVAWFDANGVAKAPTDTALWDRTQRFYANAIGTRLGYEPVPRAGIGDIDPQKPTARLDAPTNPPAMDDQRPLSGLSEEARRAGELLLEDMGVPVTPGMVRAAVAWMGAEGATIKGNNPLMLRTKGVRDLPGQIGRTDDGLAIFGSLEEGIMAASEEIRSSAPSIIAGARTGDPERFLVSVDRSGWVEGGYGGTLVRSYNALPGSAEAGIIIGGSVGLLKGASDLRGLASQEPTVAELFDIDPSDPIQMRWLQENLDAAREAATGGGDTWLFTTPGGQQVALDFDPSMVGDLTFTKATYLDAYARQATSITDLFDRREDARKAWGEHTAEVARVSMDEWQSRIDALDGVRQAALMSVPPRWADYLNASGEMYQATAVALGMDPKAPSIAAEDSPLIAMGILSDAQVERLGRMLDSLDPRSDQNPSGDRIREMVAAGDIIPQTDPRTGQVTGIAVNPAQAYVAWGDEPGRFEPRTARSHADDFELVPMESLGGDPAMVPAYLTSKVFITSGGVGAYAEPQTAKGGLPIATITDYGYRSADPPIDMSGVGRSIQMPDRSWQGAGVGPTIRFGGGPFAATSPTTRGTARISSARREDKHLITYANARYTTDIGLPVRMIQYQDPLTGQRETYYSVDGYEWMGGSESLLRQHPPEIILGDGAQIVGGRLKVGGEDHDPNKHGPLTRYLHWYGSRDDDRVAGDGIFLGARDAYLKRRFAQPGPGGSTLIDTSPADEAQGFLEGSVRLEDIVGSSFTSRFLPGATRAPAASADMARLRSTPSGVRPGASEQAGPSAPSGMPASMGITAAQQAQIGDVFARIGSASTLPVNAGQPTARAATPGAGLLDTFSNRLSSGVRAFADATVKATQAQADAARARAAAQQRIADQIAAQQRAQQAAQQAAQPVQRTIPIPKDTPRFTSPIGGIAPKPAPKPVTPAPRPPQTPAPAPPASPRRVIQPGMEV